ncbi:MAG TPA: hypothetical protein VHS31_19040 [Tepidisphaeraceae bacterium]|jgi:hypothetical protein|nr:hypothetical protein [Tepidisphaeraceae bacterium]
MTSLKFWSIIIFFALSIGGCSASLDSNEKPAGINTAMLHADVVTLHPLSMNGAKPPDGALEQAADRIRPFLRGTLRIEETSMRNTPTTLPSHPVFRSNRFKPSLADITLVYIPNSPEIGRGLFSRFDDQHQQIVLNAAGIHAMTSPFLSERDAWAIVITHELGHAMGVPAGAGHSWEDGHCTNPRCVMYPRMDMRSILAAVFSLGPPRGFCDQCRAELESARNAQ